MPTNSDTTAVDADKSASMWV